VKNLAANMLVGVDTIAPERLLIDVDGEKMTMGACKDAMW